MSTAFVLSGGGARGAFQLGVMKQLIQSGTKPDACFGTSVGAINGAGYCIGGIEELEKMWRSIRKFSDVFESKILSSLWSDGYYTLNPLRRLLADLIRRSSKQYNCLAVSHVLDIKKGITWAVSQGDPDFLDMTIASAALPVLVEPIKGKYVDGGVREYVPFATSRAYEFDEIIIILCDTFDFNLTRRWESRWPHKANTALRTAEILFHERTLNDLRVAVDWQKQNPDVKIRFFMPTGFSMDFADFDKKKIDCGISAGLKQKEISFEEIVSKIYDVAYTKKDLFMVSS